jgi:hypothetical protein
MTGIKPNYLLTDAPGGLPGVHNFMVMDKLYANQVRLDFIKTEGEHKIITIPQFSILEQIIVNITENFDSTVALGNASDADAYVADADFPKTVGIHDPIPLNIPIAASTQIKLAVGANTIGAGTIWILWRPLV